MKRSFALGIVFALASALSAEATPVTYHFDMPNWEFNTASSLFGTSAFFDITVDNGSSSTIGQSYSLTDITSFGLSAVGGSASLLGAGGVLQDTNHTFLTTDLFGIPTLDLRSQPGTGAYSFHNFPDAFQIGILDSTGGYTPFYWQIFGDAAWVVGPVTCSTYCGFQVVGTIATEVPEPVTLSIFGAGIAGALALRRRRKKKSA